MNNYDEHSRNTGEGRRRGEKPTSGSTHPIRGAGGDFNRYSRSRSSYYTQKAAENRAASSRRRPSDSAGRHQQASHHQSRPASHHGVPRRSDDAAAYSRNAAQEHYTRGGRRGASASATSNIASDLGHHGSFAPSPHYASPSNGAHEGADRFSSRDTQAKYHARAKRKRNRKRLIIVIVAIIAALALVAGAWAAILFGKITLNFNKGVSDDLKNELVATDINNKPFYTLLIGTDRSKKREENPDFGGVFRMDTILLARIDPVEKKVALVSIPRDTRVDLGEFGIQKINSCTVFADEALAVKTVSKLTGVPISHYAEINFDGFKEIVDALGGIDVKVPVTINDPNAGGKLKKGKQHLNGKQALILCRSRHAYDAIGAGDYYRSANQRMVIAAIAKKMLKSDPITLSNSAVAVSKCVTTDLSGADFMSLVGCFMGFDADTNMYTAQFPTYTDDSTGVSYEVAIKDEWKVMRDRMESGLPPAQGTLIDEATGTVMATAGDSGEITADSTNHVGKVNIRNGSEVDGLGSKVSKIIKKMGFTVDVGNANDTFEKTLIVYEDSADKEEAKMIAKKLGCGKVVKNKNEYLNDGKFMIVIGKDYPA